MPTTSFDRYSAVSSSSASSTSSTNCYNNPNSYSSSHSSSTFSPLRSATSSLYVSKLINTDSRSMQSLKQQQYQNSKIYHTPIARISPLVSNQQIEYHRKDDSWLSCEELETIEKRFTDLLQETSNNKFEPRAKSCDRLVTDEQTYKPTTLTSKFRYIQIKD
jgi:hypothetical protein